MIARRIVAWALVLVAAATACGSTVPVGSLAADAAQDAADDAAPDGGAG